MRSRAFQRVAQHWRRLNEWLRAFVIALGLLAFIHVFVFRWVTVQSTSMYATLLPGDLVLVERWPKWTGLDRGDVVVFRDPLKDRDPMALRPLLVKRIAGMPGDTVELRRGVLRVNGRVQVVPEMATWSHLVRSRSDTVTTELLDRLGLPHDLAQPGRTLLEIPLNDELAHALERTGMVISADPMGLAEGAPRHVFPFSQRYRWNSDNYGPLVIPARGDTLRITIDNLPLYDRLITRYEGHDITIVGGKVLIDGAPLTTYVVEQDHYFVLGDSRHHSADSRYWGFLPSDHIVGQAGLVIRSSGGADLITGRAWRLP